MEMLIPAPTRFPDLYPTLNVLVSFGVFGLAWLTALWTLLQTAVGYVGFGRWTLGQGLGQAPKKDHTNTSKEQMDGARKIPGVTIDRA